MSMQSALAALKASQAIIATHQYAIDTELVRYRRLKATVSDNREVACLEAQLNELQDRIAALKLKCK